MATLLQYRPAKSPEDFPKDFGKEAAPFARDFHLLAELIEKAGSNSEAFTLYISTCRNAYLTINGMFLDIRETFGRISPSNGIFGALQEARAGAFAAMEDHLHEAGLSLSAFEEKQDCWQRRQEFQNLLDSLLTQFSHLDQQVLRETLYEVVDQDGQSELASVRQFLAFDTAESNEQRSLIQKLAVTKQKLQRVRECAAYLKGLGEELKNVNAAQTALFGELALSPTIKQKSLKFRDWLESAKGVSEMEIVSEALNQTATQCPNGLEILAGSNNARDLIDFMAVLTQHLQSATGKEYTLLAELFRPNIGRPPLPPVFLVDLSIPLPPKADSRRAVAPTPVPFSQPPLEKLLIAIAQPPISSAEISDAKIQYREDEKRGIASEWGVLAIQTAAATGAKLIIFPELFIPEGALETVREIAKKVEIGVVCGVEATWVDGKYSNFANVVIPGAAHDHKQFKKYPSNYEPANFRTKGGQLCFLRSSIGSFSVVLCSDLREFDVIAAVEGQPFLDYLIVCSCNRYSELWKHLAVADAARLHCFVVISNWSDDGDANGFGKGSFCAAPTQNIDTSPNLKDEPRAEVVSLTKGGNTFKGSLLLHELNVSALFRDREKPKKGFLAPPRRRLHINQ